MKEIRQIAQKLTALNKESLASEIRVVLAVEDKLREASSSAQPQTLRELARDENPVIRARVAGNMNSPADLLETLAADSDKFVRLAVAKNEDASPAALSKLAADEKDIQIAVAKNVKTPPEALAILAEKGDESVQVEILDNEHLLPEAIDKLVSSKNPFIQFKVALHKNTPESAFLKLAEPSIDLYARMEIAGRVGMHTSVLEKLATNPNLELELKKVLSKNPNTPSRLRKAFKSEFL